MANRSDEAGKPTRKTESPRGLLDNASSEKKFHLSLYHPSSSLAFFVEHFWTVDWHFQGNESYRQESLPHPAVCIAMEKYRNRPVNRMLCFWAGLSGGIVLFVYRSYFRLFCDGGSPAMVCQRSGNKISSWLMGIAAMRASTSRRYDSGSTLCR